MKRELFQSMNESLRPSPAAVEELKERLEMPVRASAGRGWGRYAAVAACAALVLAAFPIYRAVNPPLHSYTVGQPVNMVGSAGLELGTTGGEVPAPMPSGANWGVETPVWDGERTAEALAIRDTLLARFEEDYGVGNYPDWYGGCYLGDSAGCLIVQMVDPPTDSKDLYIAIQEMAGSQRMGFGEVKYSLNGLNDLYVKVLKLLDDHPVAYRCGIDEGANQVRLEVEKADKDLLAALHRLDPEGDAIGVIVGGEKGGDALPDRGIPAPIVPAVEPEEPEEKAYAQASAAPQHGGEELLASDETPAPTPVPLLP